jgi:hypothetical protein
VAAAAVAGPARAKNALAAKLGQIDVSSHVGLDERATIV